MGYADGYRITHERGTQRFTSSIDIGYLLTYEIESHRSLSQSHLFTLQVIAVVSPHLVYDRM